VPEAAQTAKPSRTPRIGPTHPGPSSEGDLALDASALGAAYLGGATLRELAGAGRVRELRAGALARASAALRGDVAPWCPEIF
jgi:sterol carrier protein